jgi:hypothetical protein
MLSLPAVRRQHYLALRTVMVRKQVRPVPTDGMWLLSGRSWILPFLSRIQLRVGPAGGQSYRYDGMAQGHISEWGDCLKDRIMRSTEWRRPIVTRTSAVAAALRCDSTGNASMSQRRTPRCCGASLYLPMPCSNTHATQARKSRQRPDRGSSDHGRLLLDSGATCRLGPRASACSRLARSASKSPKCAAAAPNTAAPAGARMRAGRRASECLRSAEAAIWRESIATWTPRASAHCAARKRSAKKAPKPQPERTRDEIRRKALGPQSGSQNVILEVGVVPTLCSWTVSVS